MEKSISMEKIEGAISMARNRYYSQPSPKQHKWLRRRLESFLAEEVDKLVNAKEICKWEKELYENPTWSILDLFNGTGDLCMVQDDMRLFIQEQFYKMAKDIMRLSNGGLDLTNALDMVLSSRGLKTLQEMED